MMLGGPVKCFFWVGLLGHVTTRLVPRRRRVDTVQQERRQRRQAQEGPVTNPFLDAHVASLQPHQRLTLAVSVPLGLWRATMMTGVMVTYLLGANLLLLCVRDQGSRYRLLKPLTRGYLSRLTLWLMGCRVRVNGMENLRAATATPEAFIVTPNHVGYVDFWALGTAFGPCCVVAKAAVRKIPLLGNLAEGLGAVFVSRLAGREGKAELIKRRAQVGGAGSTVAPLLVFPEGTCTNGASVVAFRTGAFCTGQAVLPVALGYEAASGMSVGWVGPLSTARHALRLLCEWWVAVEVNVLPLHAPSPAELEDPASFAARVQAAIAAALGVPVANEFTVEQAISTWNKLGHNSLEN